MTSTLNQKETLLKRIDSKHQVNRTEKTLRSGKKFCIEVAILKHMYFAFREHMMQLCKGY